MNIKWGIIGCGDVTEIKSGPALYNTPGSELVAVMRRDAAKAEDYARRHHVKRWYTSAKELLNDPEVNAIYVATPPSSHASLTIAALESGRPVYVEKPMALTYSQCQAMIDVAEENKQPLYVAFYRRALPYFRKVKEILDSGRLGKILHVSSRIVMPPIPGDSDGTLWHTKPEISGGGHFVDLAPHQLDLLIHWFGRPEKQYQCVLNKTGRYKAEDFVELGLLFPHGITYSGLWCFNAGEGCNEDSFTIVGTQGSLHFSTFAMTPIVWQTSVRTEMPFERPVTVQAPLIGEIVEQLLQGNRTTPRATYEAVESTRIIRNALRDFYHGE